MKSRILALKARESSVFQQVLTALKESGNGRFEVLKVPGSGYAMLRLTQIDAVLVSRNEYCKEPPELAEVVALLQRRQRHSASAHGAGSVSVAVTPAKPTHVLCPIWLASTKTGSNLDAVQACVFRVDVLTPGAGDRPDGESEQALLDLFVRAVQSGWSTPDGRNGPDVPRECSLRDCVEDWIYTHPLLARAAAADALGWLASLPALDPVPAAPSWNMDAEHVISCALAWAIEGTAAAQQRHDALAARPDHRVLVLWHGSEARFRQALRGLLVDSTIALGQAPADPPGHDHGFADTARERAQSSPSAWELAPVLCQDLPDIDEVLAQKQDLSAIYVESDDLIEFAVQRAKDLGLIWLVLREIELESRLDRTEATARALADGVMPT